MGSSANPDGVGKVAADRDDASRSNRLRVLLMDDDERLLQSLERCLQPNHDVQAATTFDAATQVLTQDVKFDVVLCDLSMPGCSGVEVFQRISASHPHLASRFVFMTGGAITQEQREFLATQRPTCLEKPFSLALLQATLAAVVERHS